MADWNKIKTEYITEDVSYRTLAERHKVSLSTLRNRGKTEGWVDLRAQHCANLVTKSVKFTEKKASEYRLEIYALAHTVSEQLKKLIEDNTLSQLIAKGVKPRDITGALKDLSEVLHVKSTEDLKEQKERIKKLKKDVRGEYKTPKEITIKIDGGEEAWTK